MNRSAAAHASAALASAARRLSRLAPPPTSVIGEITRWSAVMLAIGLLVTLGAAELAKRATAANLADFGLIDFIQEEIEPRLAACRPTEIDCLIQVYQNEVGGLWRVIDASGRTHDSFSFVVSAFAEPEQDCPRRDQREVGGFSLFTCLPNPPPGGADAGDTAQLTYRVALRSVADKGYAIVALERSAWETKIERALERAATWRSFRVAIYAMSAALAATLIASLLLMRNRLGRQFARLRGALDAYRQGDAERLEGGYPDELQNLVDSFNAALAKNVRLVERQRRNVRKMAHDLRHQLVNVDVAARGLAETDDAAGESAPDQSAAARRGLQSETARLAALVERYLTLVDWVGPIEGQRPQLLAPALDATRKAFARRLRLEPVEIDVYCADDVSARAHPADIGIILSNLTSNAHKFAKGRIRLAAQAAPEGGVVLSVEDDGPGVPPEARAQVLRWGAQRALAQLDDAPAGSGFGLTIVAEQVRELYGGAMRLEDSPLGGLRVSVHLPDQRRP